MFIPKTAFLFSFLALCNIVIALPPACLLSVMGYVQISNPVRLGLG